MEESSTEFEREKWSAEKAFRERELALQERAQKVSEDDFVVRKKEIDRARWRSPLAVAIFAAAVAALGTRL